MARSTEVGAPTPGAASTEADEPELAAPPVVRPRRAASRAGRRSAAKSETPEKPVASVPTPPVPAVAGPVTIGPETIATAARVGARPEPGGRPTAETPVVPSGAPGTTGAPSAATAAATATGTGTPTPGASGAPSASGRLAALLVPPDTRGPRVRVGVLWFLLVLAAATSGRQWTAALWALVSALAGYQTVAVWQQAATEQASDPELRPDPLASGGLFRLVAAFFAGLLPIAAAYGTGTAGVALIAAPLLVVLLHLALGQRIGDAGPSVIAIVLPALAAISVVVAVRANLWAGLFLILAVSLYDAGAFLLGAEATGRWEGPVAGMIGALGVTFTMATFQSPPFDRTGAWIAGLVIAVCCPIGQWLASEFLPSAEARALALRRIDAYLVAGPAFVLVIWLSS